MHIGIKNTMELRKADIIIKNKKGKLIGTVLTEEIDLTVSSKKVELVVYPTQLPFEGFDDRRLNNDIAIRWESGKTLYFYEAKMKEDIPKRYVKEILVLELKYKWKYMDKEII